MDTKTFVASLESIEKTYSVEHIAVLAAYACSQAAQKRPNFDPLDALVSVCWRTGLRALLGDILRAHGVLAYATVKAAETSREWKGVRITHQVRPKQSATDPDTGAKLEGDEVKAALQFSLAAIDTAAAVDIVTAYRLEKEAEKEAKKAERKEAKRRPEYWRERLEKLLKEAAKSGVEIGINPATVSIKAMLEAVTKAA